MMAQDEARRRQEIDAWLSGPASEPPPGLASNFIDGPSLHDYNVACQTICLTIVTLLVVIRIYTKSSILKSLGWDDATSVLAWLGLVAFSIVIAESDRYGSGKHTWDVRGSDYVVYNKLANAVQLTYTLVILLTKVSILLLYFRLFSPTRVMRVAIHVNLWANVVYYVVVFFLVLLMCSPREAIWNPYLENVKCLDTRALKITSASFNLISDLAILFIPIFTVWRLQMQRKKKLVTIAVFASGLFGCVAGGVRVGLFTKEYTDESFGEDPTWKAYPIILWSYAEISAGIVCGCMTAVPAFCRHIREYTTKKQPTLLNPQREEHFLPKRLSSSMEDIELAETKSASSLQSRQEVLEN